MWIWGLKGLIEEKKRRLYLNCIDQAFKVARSPFWTSQFCFSSCQTGFSSASIGLLIYWMVITDPNCTKHTAIGPVGYKIVS